MALELIPNNSAAEPHPVYFSVEFYEEDEKNKFKIQYELEIDLGMFLDEDYARNIVFESLTVNDELIFRRTQDLEIGDMKVIKSLSFSDQQIF